MNADEVQHRSRALCVGLDRDVGGAARYRERSGRVPEAPFPGRVVPLALIR
jgi:hypothetical protein